MKRTLRSAGFPGRAAIGLFLSAAVACTPIGGGGGVPTFAKSYGGPGDDMALRAIPTADGGYLVTGTYGSALVPGFRGSIEYARPDVGDLWALKLDAFGDVQWNRLLGRESAASILPLHFIKARRAANGATYVAHRDELRVVKSGNALVDGGNVVLSLYDDAGNLSWTETFDSGVLAGFTFSSARETAVEIVADIWPTEDGDVLVAATFHASVVIDNRVQVLAGLWLLEVSSSGALVWSDVRLNAGGALNYLGDDTEIRDVYIREMESGRSLVVTSGVEDPRTQAPRFQDGKAEILSLDLGGIQSNRNTHDFRVLDVSSWRYASGTDGGAVLVGQTDDPDSGEARLMSIDTQGDEITSWTSPIDEFEHVTARAWTQPDRRFLDFWVSYGSIVEQWTQSGFYVGASAGPDQVVALGHQETDNLVWVVSERAAMTIDVDFMTSAFAAYPDTQQAWMGPGGMITDDDEVLRLLDDTAAVDGLVARDDSVNVLESGIDVIELASGDFVLAGVLGYDPTNPADSYPHAWLLSLDGDGNLLWQRGYEREGYPEPYGALPVVETGTGAVVGLGGGRVIDVDQVGMPIDTTDGTAGSVTALVPLSSGHLLTLYADRDRDTLVVERLDANLDTIWEREIEIMGEDLLGEPRSATEGVDEILIVSALRGSDGFASYALGLVVLDEDGGLVDARSYALGSLLGVGDVLIAPAEDGGFVLAATVFDASDPEGTGFANWLLIKLDANKDPLWYQLYGGLGEDYLNSLVGLEDGFLVAGHSLSVGERSEAWLLRLGPDGLVAAGCGAHIEGGPWPVGGVVEDLVATSVVATPLAALAAPTPLEVTHAPNGNAVFDVARQCSGFALIAADEPAPDPDPEPMGDHTLTVEFMGGGAGLVESMPAGIACSTTCSASFPAGTDVFLAPTPGESFFFSHWADVDQDFGIEGAVVTMNADRTVRVWFE